MKAQIKKEVLWRRWQGTGGNRSTRGEREQVSRREAVKAAAPKYCLSYCKISLPVMWFFSGTRALAPRILWEILAFYNQLIPTNMKELFRTTIFWTSESWTIPRRVTTAKLQLSYISFNLFFKVTQFFTYKCSLDLPQTASKFCFNIAVIIFSKVN